MSNNTNAVPKSQEVLFSEAPASWNTRYIDPNGFECQITLRGENGSELLEKTANAITYLLELGCVPYTYYRSVPRGTEPQKSNGNNGHKEDGAWCPIHECEMKRWEKEGRIWFSHKVNGSWCSGKKGG